MSDYINLGRVVPLHRGVYDGETAYGVNDIVAYDWNTYWHKGKEETTGVPPTDKAVWERIFESGGTNGGKRVYCWGDSLTQGEGSNVKQTDGVFNSFNTHPYTEELRSFQVVNLGCQGEDVVTIMARQGADPMTVGGFTIPAEKTAVIVGSLPEGILTESGGRAKPLSPMEAGINPCTIAGVEGILHRGSSMNDSDKNYYFTRLEAGSAVEVPEGSKIETFAMRYYRNGIAVIWMGANGGHSGVEDFCIKAQKMLDYGKYSDYLILFCREFVGADVERVKKFFTDTAGRCHVLNLYEELPVHGLTLANMVHYYFDTSSYANGDEILLKAPMLCACTMIDGSPHFETLHFSAYGYKAIGKLVAARLEAAENIAGGDTGNTEKPDEPEEALFEENVADTHGNMLLRLKAPYTSNGTKSINTGWAPYDREKNWTVVCKMADGIGGINDYNSIFESRDDTAGVETSLSLRVERGSGTPVFGILMGNRKGFNVLKSGGLFEWVGGDFSTDGHHYCVISKNGGSYVIAFDSGCWDGYGAELEGDFTADTLMLFARRMQDGTITQHATGTIEEFRIYDTNFTAAECKAIIAEMQA